MLRLSLAFIAAVFATGCGTYLIVETRNEVPAEVFVRPSHDAAGNTLPSDLPLTPIGPAPAKWEVPAEFFGGKAYVEVHFADGGKREMFGVALPRDEDADDRVLLVSPQKGVR